MKTEEKQNIYQQIHQFNNRPFDPRVKNSKPVADTYFYVRDDIAANRADFVGFLLEHDEVFKAKNLEETVILDLAFGSGNLTTHIVLDNDIDYQKIIYNDKITENTNQELKNLLPKSEVWSKDFLKYSEFEGVEKADIVVFNPQTGGGYQDGEVKWEKTEPILYEGTIEDYLDEKKIDRTAFNIIKDEKDREILIHSETLTKSAMRKDLKNLQIFHYYDVFYQSKKSKIEGSKSNNVDFRNTFDKVFKPDGILIFYGSRDYFQALFADFNYVTEYWAAEGNHLFVATKVPKEQTDRKCYNEIFEEIPNCEKPQFTEKDTGNLQELQGALDKALQEHQMGLDQKPVIKVSQKETPPNTTKKEFTLNLEAKGKLDFPYHNILLKGVPGTGKSRLINKSFLQNELDLPPNDANILRVNIHSASSNADLMQGIGIRTNKDNQVEYREKTGLILKHLRKAMQHPNQPFVIVLEEIQENSLNELIGDLIYLIEGDKRVDIAALLENGLETEFENEAAFLSHICADESTYFVEIPNLVAAQSDYQKMIFPANLYVFCTSNYRDDKKVIEDNLLRRFEVIEVYPKNKELIGEAFAVQAVSDFLEELNQSIVVHFQKKEIHPDRFRIGHAIWLKVENEQDFCRALLKVLTEFKDVKELDFREDVRHILTKIDHLPFGLDKQEILRENYQQMIDILQQKAYGDLLDV